ncbi:hypothetical protein [Candidatus Nitrotoga sp. M5]|uniref:hypothetical protein n=1 Tax=Candidatus Nitrotoga sp. M5 TaxID=2890409 RepID=UPI001EF273C5|nr:hypothetical protein [Candidatus Nitrotoga sp. M5]CAH1386942.1 conserved membrane hypothetical protein [Candidatus Nitrotoga sp. M5]
MVIETQGSPAAAVVAFDIPVSHRISWGAILAGVSLLFALSWLLLLLGSAIGVGIADATDLSAIGDGLGIGSIIWILFSAIIATFAGGLLAAKLAGTFDDRIGALHGLTVWSVGTLIIILLGASGIGGAVNAISGAMGSANKVSTTVIAGATSNDSDSMIPDAVTTNIAAVMKRQASKVLSSTARGPNSPNKKEVRSAIESLNAKDAASITSALVVGDTENARSQLAQRTNLSNSEIDSIIEGAQQKVESWSKSDDAQEAQQWLTEQVKVVRTSVSKSVSNMAGAEVSSREINKAIQELDSETMLEAGQYLIMGEPEMTKNVLAVNTNLTEEEINSIVDGAEQETKEMINEVKAKLNKASEAAGTYLQAVLWSAFIAAALGMLAGLVGGHMGARAVRRIYAVR